MIKQMKVKKLILFITLFLFPPLGAILMWVWMKNWRKWTKFWITGICSVWTFLAIIFFLLTFFSSIVPDPDQRDIQFEQYSQSTTAIVTQIYSDPTGIQYAYSVKGKTYTNNDNWFPAYKRVKGSIVPKVGEIVIILYNGKDPQNSCVCDISDVALRAKNARNNILFLRTHGVDPSSPLTFSGRIFVSFFGATVDVIAIIFFILLVFWPFWILRKLFKREVSLPVRIIATIAAVILACLGFIAFFMIVPAAP